MGKRKILLVEDDPVLARGLQLLVEAEGHATTWASSLQSAFSTFPSEDFDLVLLDLGLTDGSGFEFLHRVRERGSQTPIIILTAQTDEDSVVKGLQNGANDYIKKPFSHRELVARVGVVFREPLRNENRLRYGELSLNLDQRMVKYGDLVVEVNRREFDVLRLLVQRAEAIVTRESLLSHLDKEGEIFDRTIDSHVSHLRSRFRSLGVKDIKISSVYGLGYRLEKA